MLHDDHQAMVAALKGLTVEELNSPRLAMAFVQWRPQSNKAALRVHWVSNRPLATGLRFRNAEETMDLQFTQRMREINEADAVETLVFGAEIWLQGDDPKWTQLERMTETPGCTVMLLQDDREISSSKDVIRLPESKP